MRRFRQMFCECSAYAAKGWRWLSDRLWWSFSLVGISSLLWLMLRSGARPSRILYPCQKVAAANVEAWVGISLIGVLARLRRKVWGFLSSRRTIAVVFAAGGLVILGLVVGKALDGTGALSARELEQAAEKMAQVLSPSSDIFVVRDGGGPDGMRHLALDRLVNLMGAHGLCFYRTEKRGIGCSPTGLVGPNDVVLIKVNCQWAERGGTNTDVVKGLIYQITQHPDGFTGEIVVADNGQDVGIGGSLDWPNSNAEDYSQSAQDVVNLFSGSYKASTYLWTRIRNQVVDEFDQKDMRDGYVLAATPDPRSNFRVSYPKFTTPYGTRISFKRGIYDSKTMTYDKERLKVINVPVLKSHSGFGVTACVKHYIGLQSQPLSDGHNRLSQGSMGTLMADVGLPTLNIIDAIWVNANPIGYSGTGPSTSYSQATRLDTLMASVDPVALDHWASKNVLMPAAVADGHTNVDSMNPGKPGIFQTYLQSAKNILLLEGYPVTTDSKSITVFNANDERPVLTNVGVDGSGNATLSWVEVAPGSFVYTVEQTDDLASAWQPAPGTAWPISATEWVSAEAIQAATRFYRLKREPAD